MANQEKDPATGPASPAQDKTAVTASGQQPAAQDEARDAAVIADEEEAMRRKREAEARNEAEEAPEAENPQIAEIESIISAVRH